MKILIAVSDKKIRSDIKEILRLNLKKGVGIQYIEAPDGKMALAEIILIKPDIAILDIKLPFADAYKILSTLKYLGKDELLAIPIIVISSHPDKTIFMKLLKLGAKDFLIKPIDIESLITKIEAHLKY